MARSGAGSACSRSSACRSGSRLPTNVPAGPTPPVNGSHHSSKLGCSRLTVRVAPRSRGGQRPRTGRPGDPRGRRPARFVVDVGSSSRAAAQKSRADLASHRGPRRTPRRRRPAGSHAPSPQPGDGIGHEMDHELGERRVECSSREGQMFGGSAQRRDARVAGRAAAATNGADGSTAASLAGPSTRDKLGSEGARAAADIDREEAVVDARRDRPAASRAGAE